VNVRKTLVIAIREYQAAVRTKAFVITIVAMPVFMGVSILGQVFLKDKVDTTDKRIAVIDRSGRLLDEIKKSAADRNENDTFVGEGANRKKIRPLFLIEEAADTAGPHGEVYALSERVRHGDLFAFMIVSPEAIDGQEDAHGPPVVYHSNSPSYDDFTDWVTQPINQKVQELRFEKANLDPDIVREATRPVVIRELGLVSLDEAGNVTQAKPTNKIATFAVPMGLMMLMFMTVMVGASPLTQSVIEEKMNRVAEMLLGSVPPFQIMMGKLLGTVGVSLTLGTIYLGGGFIALAQSGFAALFPAHLVWWFVVFQILAVLLYGSLFIAVGAAVSDLKEAQNMLMPVTFILIAPMFVWINVLREPTATFSVMLSLFPPATPMLMLLRQCVPPGVPLWQPLLGIVLVTLATLLCVFAAGRIFRIGILLQGKGAKASEVLRWIIRG
jgi:ABC-2 type transport system permease protein